VASDCKHNILPINNLQLDPGLKALFAAVDPHSSMKRGQFLPDFSVCFA
jgi:hypothetical protein